LKNDHRHRLGSRNYKQAKHIWKQWIKEYPEELKPITSIRSRRCRSYLFARVSKTSDGKISIPHDVLELARKIVSAWSFFLY